MKHELIEKVPAIDWSLPTRGAWIETKNVMAEKFRYYCRSPLGGRGLKLILAEVYVPLL